MRSHLKIATITALTLLATSVVALPTAEAEIKSGIGGRVIENKPCNDTSTGTAGPETVSAAGCAATVLSNMRFEITRRSGRVVDRFTTNPRGRFEVKLRPGHYLVGPGCGSRPVRVERHEFTHRYFACKV